MRLRGAMIRRPSLEGADYKIVVQGPRAFLRHFKAAIVVHTISAVLFNVEEEIAGYNKRDFHILPPVPRPRPKTSELLAAARKS